MRDVLGIAGVVLLIAWIVMHLAGCGLFGTAAAEATYTAEHLRCVDKSATLAESRACRAGVDLRWGIAQTVRDAGGDQ